MFEAVLLVLILFNGVPETVEQTPMNSPEQCAAEIKSLISKAEVTSDSRVLVAACKLVPIRRAKS
jgi:hypothetical protein